MPRVPPSREWQRAFFGSWRMSRLSKEPTAASTHLRHSSFGSSRTTTLQYLRQLWPQRWLALVAFVVALVSACATMIHPLFTRFIVDEVLLGDSVDDAERFAMLSWLGAAALAVVVLGASTNLVRDYQLRLVSVRVTSKLRRALFERLIRLPLGELARMKTGGVLSRLSGDVDSTAGFLQLAIVAPLMSVVRLFVAVSMLVALNWKLALVAFSIVPGATFVSYVTAKRIRPVYARIRTEIERVDGRAGEVFSGIRIVRAFRREAAEARDYVRARHAIARAELFAYRRELLLSWFWGLLTVGVPLIVVWFGGYLFMNGTATIGDILAFQWYAMLLIGPVWQIVNSFPDAQRALASLQRVFDVLSTVEDMPDEVGAKNAPDIVETIELKDVGVKCDPDSAILSAINVKIDAGNVVALVGRSGAGKTTFADLIARFRDPTTGRLLLNGNDLRTYKRSSYRRLLGVVPQDVFLFDGSIRENILYGRPSASAEEIRAAAERASVHEFIERLPNGYDTHVGGSGVNLSGGQKQRIAIARAILADPKILILDEATSSLDTESERTVQRSIATLLAGRTTFVIAHRLSTVRRADLILVIDDGRISERGTHQDLISAKGRYYEMLMRQASANRES